VFLSLGASCRCTFSAITLTEPSHDGHLSVFRYPSLNSYGNTVDHQGRLVTCEPGG